MRQNSDRRETPADVILTNTNWFRPKFNFSQKCSQMCPTAQQSSLFCSERQKLKNKLCPEATDSFSLYEGEIPFTV